MGKIQRMRPPTNIPDSSMADIAFLLLVFFIATTTIAEEYGLSLILPARATANAPRQVARENVLVLSTDESGNVYMVDDEAVPLSAIRPMVRERAAVNDKLVVSIEPHPQAPYRAMVDLLDEVKAAEITRVSLKTTRR